MTFYDIICRFCAHFVKKIFLAMETFPTKCKKIFVQISLGKKIIL